MPTSVVKKSYAHGRRQKWRAASDSELVADLGSQLKREDYAGWETEAELRLRLQRSVVRLLTATGQTGDAAADLARALLAAL